MNTKEQGAVGVAIAIGYYTRLGYAVFVPVSDVRRYDLLVDDGLSGPLRVEVKTTSASNNRVMLRTQGGNQSWNGTVKKISSTDCDLVFIYNINTGSQAEYKAIELEGKSSVTLH